MNQTVEKLIAENKISQAIRKLHQISKHDSELKIEVIQLSARYEEYLHQKRHALSDEGTTNTEIAKIRAALIDIGERAKKSQELSNNFPINIKASLFKYLIPVSAIAVILAVGFFAYGKLVPDVTPLANGAKASMISYFDNEQAAHADIENSIKTSKNVKLYLVRGKKLFKNDKGGLFNLVRYDRKDINKLFSCQVLLLDFDSLTQTQYDKMASNVNLVWTNFAEDKATQNKSIETIKSLEEDKERPFDIRVKEYFIDDFQYFKMFIFDKVAYFTIYHKIGSVKEHQEYKLIKTSKGDPLYESLVSIFDSSWDKAHND